MRPALEKQNPKMGIEQVNLVIRENWDMMGEEERSKYRRIAKPRLGDYFGDFRKVDPYKSHPKAVVELEAEGTNVKKTQVPQESKNIEVEEEAIRIIEMTNEHIGANVCDKNESYNETPNDNLDLEVLFPENKESPASTVAEDCTACEGLEMKVSELKKEVTDKTEIIARLIKRVRYLEDITEYRY